MKQHLVISNNFTTFCWRASLPAHTHARTHARTHAHAHAHARTHTRARAHTPHTHAPQPTRYLRAGDWEEHAILLCNYFLHMNSLMEEDNSGGGNKAAAAETYCCLGRAVPDGDVVFVLHRDNSKEDDFTVWNPRNGTCVDGPTINLFFCFFF